MLIGSCGVLSGQRCWGSPSGLFTPSELWRSNGERFGVKRGSLSCRGTPCKHVTSVSLNINGQLQREEVGKTCGEAVKSPWC
ncbi:hypothetical protein SRHO_G00264840 [Serrasalmus rhombeus]